MSDTDKIRNRYDRYSKFYDRFEAIFESKKVSEWRRDILSNLEGEILEVGVGTGKNLQYYGPKAKVTGIDFSPGMLSKATEKAYKLNNPNITLQKMDAQHLEFQDNHFDYIITTFVLCSIPDPVLGLQEMQRVLKPEGYLISLEHVLSSNPIIALHEHLMNPFTRYLLGFNVNRATPDNIQKAGFEIVDDEYLGFFDVFRKIRAKKKE